MGQVEISFKYIEDLTEALRVSDEEHLTQITELEVAGDAAKSEYLGKIALLEKAVADAKAERMTQVSELESKLATLESEGIKFDTLKQGFVLSNKEGTIIKLVGLNDKGDGLIYEDIKDG